mgnify:CR=1 FL=1|jgi:hypothetical protein
MITRKTDTRLTFWIVRAPSPRERLGIVSRRGPGGSLAERVLAKFAHTYPESILIREFLRRYGKMVAGAFRIPGPSQGLGEGRLASSVSIACYSSILGYTGTSTPPEHRAAITVPEKARMEGERRW